MVGSSAEIQELKALIRAIGPSDSTVLILGDSGTGKELVAEALHRASPRADYPFIPVNCAAIPRDLLESELFGHCKGAFTGAISDRKGRFELADKGTILLDEIGDMPMDLQVKLLRVLQERVIDPVGAVKSQCIDVRVIAATHEDLELLVEEGKFREDLFFRLNVLPVAIKPLRDHTEDIPQLFEYFAKQYATQGCKPISLHQRSLELMFKYHWPGNIRELCNLVDRYTALYPEQQVDLSKVPQTMLPMGMRKLLDTESDGVNDGQTLQFSATGPDQIEQQMTLAIARGQLPFPQRGIQLKASIADLERSIICQVLQRTEGNVSQAAKLLSVQRTTLIEKISKHGLRDYQWQPNAKEQPNSPCSELEERQVEDIISMAQGHLLLPPQGLQLKSYLREIEHNLIQRALQLRDGNVSKTAELLGLQRTTLIEKLNK
jgi:sigma-54 specific flagellar transcriptional regulator A